MADRLGGAFRRLLFLAEARTDAAIFRGLSCLKTAFFRSMALLAFVTLPDHFFCVVFPDFMVCWSFIKITPPVSVEIGEVPEALMPWSRSPSVALRGAVSGGRVRYFITTKESDL